MYDFYIKHFFIGMEPNEIKLGGRGGNNNLYCHKSSYFKKKEEVNIFEERKEFKNQFFKNYDNISEIYRLPISTLSH